MELKELGKTGVKVSEIGIGMWRYSGGVEPVIRGISLGATFIDTAEMYRTEGVVGQAVRGQRENVFIATRVLGSHLKHEEVINAADSSLRELGTDYIDLYQIHWPNSRVPIGETMRAMEELVDMGKVRFIGVSNFSVRELQEAQDAMRKYGIVSNQVRYNLTDRSIEQDTLSYCQRNNVTVIAYTPLASGSLASKPLLMRRQAMGVLEKIAQETNKTIGQVSLNWCTSRENVIAIPKSNRVERMVENCGASGWRLSTEQVEALDQAFG